jgi:hypothetical protein
MKSNSIFFLFIFLLQSIFVFSQETPTTPSPSSPIKLKQPVFGVGLKTLNLLSEIQMSPYLTPGNRIIITINPVKHFRIQPEIGYFTSKTFSEALNEDLKRSSIAVGIGLFGVWSKDQMNFYAGLKYVSTKNSIEDEDAQYNPNPP